jgi:hypothetical protein
MMHHLRNSTVTICFATGSTLGSAAPAQLRSSWRKWSWSGKFKLQLISVWVLLFLLLLAEVSRAGTNYFYTPQSVGNIAGRAYADGDAPLHWLNMSTFAGTRYCTQSSGSNSSTGSTWSGWRWYGESINRTQLLNAINDANSKFGAGLSTNTANYSLLFISIQDEIAWPSGNGWLPFSAEQIWTDETY